jgi:D-tagatose-1,6-bisphosphate aldolase subunit GatZ/KbaZ
MIQVQETVNDLDQIVLAQKQGQARGFFSVCSAHPAVLSCAVQQALNSGQSLLIEATCNQVNQYGGYTGMRPLDFKGYVQAFAEQAGLPLERIILGGDHLGPSPWQEQPAEQAMRQAEALVREFVQAGFKKIHLDASMALGDDTPGQPLPPEVCAARSARLARAAEDCGAELRYVIGTEVPVPGGAREHEEAVAVSRVQDVAQTLALSRQAFVQAGLEAAWEKVIAVVVQPGVEFGDDFILDYQPERAEALSRFIEGQTHLVYEAHSTDYQTGQALCRLVRDHFAILKVGPELTYAYREAVFSLAHIEEETIPYDQQSHLIGTLEAIMVQEPDSWRKYYHGLGRELNLARKYSLSDRIRYYWPHPEVQRAVERLLDNLRGKPAPFSLLSQYMPVQWTKIRQGQLQNEPRALVGDHILQVIEKYSSACRPGCV